MQQSIDHGLSFIRVRSDDISMYQDRTYRNLVNPKDLASFRVVVKETDLFVHAGKRLEDITRERIFQYRGNIESYIQHHPLFATSLTPWQIRGPAPLIVRDMAAAGQKSGVGPMAAVAGAIAEYVGTDLLKHTDEVVVENGGDLFIKTHDPLTIGIYAGNSPLSLRVGLTVDSGSQPIAVCTSSGTVGHSLSMGIADAVCTVSTSGSLSDAAATSIGNHVRSPDDVQKAIDFGNTIEGVSGIIVIAGDQIGLWGDITLVPLQGKKG
jgi:ApbE superfamily uncharacterized protein (UPF0280 family)